MEISSQVLVVEGAIDKQSLSSFLSSRRIYLPVKHATVRQKPSFAFLWMGNPIWAVVMPSVDFLLPKEVHKLLGNYVVSMLAIAGSIHLAQELFDRLSFRNSLSWSSLINGYIEHGELQHALSLCQMMPEDSLQPNGVTYVALLKACTKLKDMEVGGKLHKEIHQAGLLNDDPFVGSALIAMYAKLDLTKKAQEVFDTLPIQSTVIWNALIAGYVQHNQTHEALKCYEQLRQRGVSPDAVTFTCILKACSSVGATVKGIEIHEEVLRSGLLKANLFVGNMLIDMYAKCGLSAKAQEVFDMLPTRNIISWTALIASYVQNEQSEEALKCFEQMQNCGLCANAVTFACILRACITIGAKEKGMGIHAEILRVGLIHADPFVGSALVDMYAKWGMLSKAREVFDMLVVCNVVTWTALISGYVQHDQADEALECFEQMQILGVHPNATTFACTLKACGNIGAVAKGSQIHTQIQKKGLMKTEVCVGGALIDMYAKCGLLTKAQDVFDTLPQRNVVTWCALIMGLSQQGFYEEALKLYEQMQCEGVSPNGVTYACCLKACASIQASKKGFEIHAEIARKGLLETNVLVGSTLVIMYVECGSLSKAQEVFDMLPMRNAVTWNALIGGYTHYELSEEALNHFEQMKCEGVSPNAITYACSLKACSSIGAMEKGSNLHAEVGKNGLLKTDVFVGSAIVDMYFKCGLPAKAQEVFDLLPVRNVVTWTALITGYAQLGDIEEALLLFDRMIKEGNKPDAATFVNILNACSHAGTVDKGLAYFEAMSTFYGIPPTLHHHICMVDLLGRAGQLDIAVEAMEKTPCHPNSVMWLSVLGACRKWGDVEVGSDVFQQAMQLDDEEAAAYVCMFNIYADMGILECYKQ